MERAAVMSNPEIELGDVSIHLDDTTLSATTNFIDIVAGYGIQQLLWD